MSDFTDYIQGYIGSLSGTFGWGQATLDFIVSEALLEYPAETEADATDLKKAKALLRFKTMERALIELSDSTDYAADGESFRLSQIPANIREMWVSAKRDVIPYMSSSKISVRSLDNGYSPMRRNRL